MKIGYDAKRFFQNRTGLGNYSRDLVRIMQQFYPDNSYLLTRPLLRTVPTNRSRIWIQFACQKDLSTIDSRACGGQRT